MLLRLQQLIRANADAIANSIVLEQGKTVAGMCGARYMSVVSPGICQLQMHMGTYSAVFKLSKHR